MRLRCCKDAFYLDGHFWLMLRFRSAAMSLATATAALKMLPNNALLVAADSSSRQLPAGRCTAHALKSGAITLLGSAAVIQAHARSEMSLTLPRMVIPTPSLARSPARPHLQARSPARPRLQARSPNRPHPHLQARSPNHPRPQVRSPARPGTPQRSSRATTGAPSRIWRRVR